MNQFAEVRLTVRGIPTLARRKGPAGEEAMVFLHGGIAGSTPYCSGSHIWGDVPAHFEARSVMMVDLPGYGSTSPLTGPPSIDALSDWLFELLSVAGVRKAFLVAHDLGGLIALELAAQHPALLSGVSLISSTIAAPTGDGVENLTLAHPPRPLWTAHSQRWAFEQLSYAPHHITDDLIGACVNAADGEPHRAMVSTMAGGALESDFIPSVMRAKARFYEVCRGPGLTVPVQVLWGSHDRLGSVDHGLWLFKLVASRQRVSQFHVINRVGSFPFREDRKAFQQIVGTFAEIVRAGAPENHRS